MSEVKSPSSCPHLAFALAAVALFPFFVVPPLQAQGTHLWTQSHIDEFEKGTPQGVAIASNGNLREGPGLSDLLITPSSFVWSVAVDKSGTPFLGTGSPASVLRGSLEKDAKPFTLFESHDVSVQVVRIGPDGSLYAATVPGGKVYKLDPHGTSKQDESNAKVVFDLAKAQASDPDPRSRDSKAHYIWDMTFDSSGKLYIAVGGPGAIYRIDPSNPNRNPDLFFKSDEQHIRSLAWDERGNLIAGSDGSGLVYRISPQGKGYVLYEAPRREITSVAVGADGTIYAASVGDKSHNPLPPIPVQGVGTITFTIVQPSSLQAANASASAPEGTEIYALAPDQAPRKIWSSKDDIVYALDPRPDGILAISGNRGHIFRIQQNGDFADIAHADAQQGLSLANVHGGGEDAVLIGTGNTGRLYSLANSGKHEYASDVLDAGAYARFGRVEVDPDSENYELLTRTGNVEQPARGHGDWGWSDWQPLKDGSVQSPSGRFLQWKAILRDGGKLSGVGVNYLPVNAAPEVDDLVVAPGARLNAQVSNSSQQQTVSINFATANQPVVIPVDTGNASTPLQAVKDRTAVTVRWAAHDDNGDDLVFSLFLRGDGESDWHLLKDGITERAYSFDAALIPDGGYRVKVVASDAPSHNPGESLTGSKVSERFEIDTTPPVLSALKAEPALAKCAQAPCPAPVHVTFDAEDAASPIGHAEYSVDAGPWQYIDPVGKLSDSKREHYDFEIPAKALEAKTGEHLLTVRAYDRHENVGLAKTVFNSPAEK